MLGCGEVRGDVGKGEGGDVGMCGRKCVGAPHPHTLPYTSPIPLPTRQHTSPLTPYSLPHPFPHFSTPHTSFLTFQHTSLHLLHTTHTSSHSSPHFPLHSNTLPHSPHALFHTSPYIFPHSFDYVAKLPLTMLP